MFIVFSRLFWFFFAFFPAACICVRLSVLYISMDSSSKSFRSASIRIYTSTKKYFNHLEPLFQAIGLLQSHDLAYIGRGYQNQVFLGINICECSDLSI